MSETAVVYHYFEKDENYRDNFIFFMTCAWRPDLEFFVVVAGEHSVSLPVRPNIHYVFTPNYSHDFGSYCDLVNSGRLDSYEYLIFVNCTVRGPFLPPYAACLTWTAPFLDLLVDDVHLCGSTINILHEDRPLHKLYQSRNPQADPPFSHVQTSVHAMTAECFSFLRDVGHYSGADSLEKYEAIVRFEIGMSQRVLARGWNIDCLLPPYNSIDYRLPHKEINPATKTGHPQSRGGYFGLTPHPYELIFIKTGWDVLDAKALAFHSLVAIDPNTDMALDWSELRRFAERLEKIVGWPIGPADKSQKSVRR